MIGESAPISNIKAIIEKVAPTEARVLWRAKWNRKRASCALVASKKERSRGPMVEVNCAAIPAELIESELLGISKGLLQVLIKTVLVNLRLRTKALYF